MKDKFKIIIIVLALIFLSLYSWDLFLYNKYGEIGRYQPQTAFTVVGTSIGQGIIDTKTGKIFTPDPQIVVLDKAENWYSINPITLEREGQKKRRSDFTGIEKKDIFDRLENKIDESKVVWDKAAPESPEDDHGKK